jgi:EmrB/QacA subfamily drug resistance transporter
MTDMPTVDPAETSPRVPQEPAPKRAPSDQPARAVSPDGLAPAVSVVDHALVRSVMVGLMLAMFLSALEQSIVAPALPTIGRSLSDIENLSWVVTAYLLSATAVTPLFGKLSDIYGRRVILLIAIGIFIAGSIACALAPTMLTLIIARGGQGLGGGGILPLAQTIIADLLSPRERPRYQSYSAIAFVSASILGPVIGGFLTDQLHWSLIFWINVPLGAAAMLMTDRTLRRLPRHERPHRLDVIGAVLMLGAAVALMLALNWGGTRYAWSSTPILALIASSLLLWILFALRLIVAPEPFIPTTMLRDPVVGAIIAAGFFSIGTIVGLTIYLPLYFQLALGLSASASGLALISFMAGSVIGSVIAGRLVAQLARYKRVPMVGLVLAIAMLAAFAARPGELSVAEVCALLAVGGLGLGTMYPITTLLMQNAVPLHQVGTATGTLNFFRLLGGAIIVAVFGAIVLGAFGASDARFAHDTLIAAGQLSHADFAAKFRWVFVAAAVFLAAALLAVMLVHERPLRGPPLRPASGE